ncbi:tetratricopeptide repeat protein [Actinoplanes sp. NPDC051494]|uniref:tetratricopeptide repeat protein n=1 Tax=Actinoplanes sp. NPDC051494 TaxID=3363907 RepID=UPI0037B8F81E
MVPDGFAGLPDPAQAGTIADLVERLRLLKVWAGDPSYETIKNLINVTWAGQRRPANELAVRSTVANCFQPGRRRLNTDLVLAVVQALHPDTAYVTRWRQALRVIGGEIEAVSQVRVDGSLPPDLAGFTGRGGELDALCRAARAGDAVVISAIEGMAGVGKTQLAIHAGHLLHREEPFARVLFVNLRGFHPEPDQPPADPAAVLDEFLRLLGVPGHQIPHGLDARAAAYRSRLAGLRALVVLDNAAGLDQVRPLLPDTPGCLALVTSRRSLAGLPGATELAVDVFSPGEAAGFLTAAVGDVPVGSDPDAVARICRRAAFLPLALSLIAGHIRGAAGWTLTDHADRLDERHQARHLDSGVELALDLSYRDQPADRRRLLRLAALHPGQDFDAHAAAALLGPVPGSPVPGGPVSGGPVPGDAVRGGAGVDAVRESLDALCRDHLLQPAGPGRYTFHDLVRTYATGRAHDQDPPPERRAALTRLFDHYLATAAAAMDTLHPAEAGLRPRVPAGTAPGPDVATAGTATGWLDAERRILIAVIAHAATHGWPRHCISMARTLARYLRGGYYADAETAHGYASAAARDTGDVQDQGHALIDLGHTRLMLGRSEPAAACFRQALDLFRAGDDPAGQARALFNLGGAEYRTGNLPAAIELDQRAVALYRQAGDRTGEARVLSNLCIFLKESGRLLEAVDHGAQSLEVARQIGHTWSEALALHSLGEIEVMVHRHESAGDHLRQALALYRGLGDHDGEAGVLDSLGTLYTRTGRPAEALDCHQRSVTIFRRIGARHGEAWALNGLGEAAQAVGRPADAVTHHTAAHTIATEIGDPGQLARAHAGLGHAHQSQARDHYRDALTLYTELGAPEAAGIHARLAAIA